MVVFVRSLPFPPHSKWHPSGIFSPLKKIKTVQGVFYGVLFAFWLIFAGEHCIDDADRNNLVRSSFFLQEIFFQKSYRLNLASIGIASLALLIYECSERGMQISDPFHTIWSSTTGTRLAVSGFLNLFKISSSIWPSTWLPFAPLFISLSFSTK